MPRPIQATVDVSALRHNLAQMKAAAPDALVWGVVKANAYGHGIERVFEGLRAADGIALLDLAEAERVRQLGWRGPILLLEGVFETRDLELCSRLNLWHVVHCEAQIDMLAVHKTHQPHRVFLKMNSGMNRLGFAPQAFKHMFDAVAIGIGFDHRPHAGVRSSGTHAGQVVTQGVSVNKGLYRAGHRQYCGTRVI